MQKIDTFSANSLKELDKSFEDFKNKYIYNLSIYKKDERTLLGQKFHSLICFYIRGFDVSRLVLDLNKKEFTFWQKLEEKLKPIKSNFIKTEYSFLIKDEVNNIPYYLTGRFDGIFKDENGYIIYDWKTLNLPKNPYDNLQSVVYLYALNKIYKTNKIKMRYLSIEKLETLDVDFVSNEKYKEKIDKIILKLPWFNSSSSNDSGFQELNF